jgi:FKBP-type peptidyl-prolyl cis-trans isomerase SlyD
MLIEKNKVVTFHYRLKEAGQEQTIETSHGQDPVLYLYDRGGILPALAQAMAGHRVGDEFSVSLTPEQAYGERHASRPQRIPIKHLSRGYKKLRPGQTVAVNTHEGPRNVTVLKVGKFNIDVDTNHPLAGKALVFEVEIVDIRDATREELTHGHAHGVGGHQH